MTIEDFLEACQSEGFDIAKGDYKDVGGGVHPGYFVTDPSLVDERGDPPITHCSFEGIERHDWPVILRHIRQGLDVTHYTRIVGYLSRVSNWNPSKRAELRDRQKGDYKIGSMESTEETIPGVPS